MPSKDELMKLAESWAKKAERAYDNYQDCGAQRYYNAYRRADDMEEACRMAANAADEHAEYLNMRAFMANFASRAASIRAGISGEEETGMLVSEIAEVGRLYGLIDTGSFDGLKNGQKED